LKSAWLVAWQRALHDSAGMPAAHSAYLLAHRISPPAHRISAQTSFTAITIPMPRPDPLPDQPSGKRPDKLSENMKM